MAESNCVACGHAREPSEQLGIFCAGCGRPRLPFARAFVWSTLALITIFFFTEVVSIELRRPFIIVFLLAVEIWFSVQVLRHRPKAVFRMVAALLPTSVIFMNFMNWGAHGSAGGPFLIAIWIVVVGAWVFLVANSLVALSRGFARSSRDPELGQDALALTVFTLIGLAVSLLHAVLPGLIAIVRHWQSGNPRHLVLGALETANGVVGVIVELRLEATLLAAAIVLTLTIRRVLRANYKYLGRYSVGESMARSALRLVRNILKLFWTTLKFWRIILASILPTILLVGASLFLSYSTFALSWFIEFLWSSKEFVALLPLGWLQFLVTLVATVAGLVAVDLVASGRRASGFTATLDDVRKDTWGLLQAFVFSGYTLSYSFFICWIPVMIFRLAQQEGGENAILFWVALAAYISLAIVAFVRKIDTDEVASQK